MIPEIRDAIPMVSGLAALSFNTTSFERPLTCL
ncbi:Uncharacterised protein [Vibrio cholerae]|nr:Uncharacterised protein [Vibrio cholerae]CSC56180.1 Uncharacterised protein [Vibrio cholerae]